MNFTQLKFTLGRKIDFSHPPHRVLIFVCLLAFIGEFFWTGHNYFKPAVSALSGIFFVISILLTWAMTRELDPSHPASAMIAIASSVITYQLLGLPAVFPTLFLLLLFRSITRTCGGKNTVIDVLILVLVGIGSLVTSWSATILFSQLRVVLTLITIILTTLLSIQQKHLVFVADDGHKVALQRVRAGLVITVTTALILSLINQENSFFGLYPFWIALILSTIFSFVKVKNRN